MFHCAAIQKNIRVEGSAVTGLKILPCCVYQADQNYRTLAEYYSSTEYQELQSTSTWPRGCGACRQQENQNQTSYRQLVNQSLDNIQGRRFEIFPSNICNLKCVMCNPANSSAFAQEQQTIGIINNQYAKEFDLSKEALDLIDSNDDIESISLIGGEFFLSKGNLEILDLAIQRQIPIRVVTNATVILPDHLAKLKQLQDLELQISCDGVHEHYEFMRYPARWDRFIANSETLIQELPQAKINFHFVVQPLNAENLVPSLAFLNTLKRPTRFTNLVTPEYLNWSILTDSERLRIADTMTKQLAEFRLTERQKLQVQSLIETISGSAYSAENRQTFNRIVGKTMQHRGVDLVVAVGLEPTINTV